MLKYFLFVGALLSMSPASNVVWAGDLPAASRWLPPDTAVFVEVQQPAALLEPLLSPEAAKAVASFPLAEEQKLKLQALQGVVSLLELQVGTNWRSGIHSLVGNGLAFAIEPSGATLLAVDAKDEKLLNKLHESIRVFATGGAKEDHSQRAYAQSYRGVSGWSFKPNEAHVLLGSRLLLANRPQFLEQVLDLRADPNAATLASSAFYRAARQAVGPDTVASVFLNMQILRLHPKVQAALATDSNPLATLLLADTREALRQANWLAVGVSVNKGQLELRFLTDGAAPAASKAVCFTAPPGPEAGPWPQLAVPGAMAEFSLYRDLHSFYAAKDELFGERTSGLVFFENMMGIFFSGKELTEGVLGQVRPEVRVVVAEQRYDPAIGTPSVQVPAFAAVLRLRHPEQFSLSVEEAWQKALGLANFTRGQKALPGLILDRATHADVKYSFAYYQPPAADDKGPVDARYNYRPALVRTGDYVIFSSTDALATDLIDAVKKETVAGPKPLTGGHSFAEMDAARLRSILAANFESLVRKNMVEKGHSREQAEKDVRNFLTLLDCFERANLTLSREQNGHPQATLALKLKLPSAKLPGTTAMLSK